MHTYCPTYTYIYKLHRLIPQLAESLQLIDFGYLAIKEFTAARFPIVASLMNCIKEISMWYVKTNT